MTSGGLLSVAFLLARNDQEQVAKFQCIEGLMLKKLKSGLEIEDPVRREKDDDATASVISVAVVIPLIFCLVLLSLYWK